MAKKTKVGIKVPTKNELMKRYPGMAIASENDDDRYPKIPSRHLAFNYQIGGGLPYGKVMEIFGEESSGKSLMAYDFAFVTQTLGGVVLIADAEQAFTNSWGLANGLDLSRVITLKATEVETISDWLADMALYWRSQLVNNEPILFILDSTAALDCMANINSKMVDSKADMGNRAKAIYKMLRIRSELMYKLGVSQIYINQLRKNLKAGMFENPDTTPGGGAMKFYASIRVAFYGGRQITEKIRGKERKVGRVTSIRIIKNKVAPPRGTIKGAPMYFNPDSKKPVGFDKYYFLSDALLEANAISKNNSGTYSLKGKTLCRGDEKFLAMIEENDELRKKLLRKAGINTISVTRKKIESMGGNLFPIDDIKYSSQTEEPDNEDE